MRLLLGARRFCNAQMSKKQKEENNERVLFVIYLACTNFIHNFTLKTVSSANVDMTLFLFQAYKFSVTAVCFVIDKVLILHFFSEEFQKHKYFLNAIKMLHLAVGVR